MSTDTTGFRLDVRGGAAQALGKLDQYDSDVLARMAFNHILNEFVSRENDRGDGPYGVEIDDAIPYAGWGWRSIDFFNPRLATIAHTADGTAFCMNNKWDYEERDLTDDELAQFRSSVWQAYQAYKAGGLLSDIIQNTRRHLQEAGDFIRLLEVEP